MQQRRSRSPAVSNGSTSPPRFASDEAALVRPIAVTTCDLDHLIVSGRVPLPGPFARPRAVADVVDVGDRVAGVRPGDRVVVPFQISCGHCGRCRKGLTSSCENAPVRSAYGLGPIGGTQWGGALSDLVMVPFADAMLEHLPPGVAPSAVACASDNLCDGWRTVAPFLAEAPGADVLVMAGGAISIAFYAVAVAKALGAGRVVYRDVDETRGALAERLGATVEIGPYPRRVGEFPITVDASADPDGLACALRSVTPYGACTSVGIYHRQRRAFEMYGRGVVPHGPRERPCASPGGAGDRERSLDPRRSRPRGHRGDAIDGLLGRREGSWYATARLGLRRAFAAVGVFERTTSSSSGRHLDHVDVGDGDHPVDGARRAVERLLRPHAERLPIGAVTDLQVHLAGLHQKRLVLAVVVLARQALPGGDVEDLSHVARCLGPDELVAPRLLHAAHRVFLCRDGAAVKAHARLARDGDRAPDLACASPCPPHRDAPPNLVSDENDAYPRYNRRNDPPKLSRRNRTCTDSSLAGATLRSRGRCSEARGPSSRDR